MKVELKTKPKNPIIIEGFPGFGLVGTIATEFLIKHLNAEPIGKISSDKILPVAAIHESKVVEPLGIFYDKKHNLVIIHVLSAVRGIEWQISDALLDLAKQVSAKRIISLESIGSEEKDKFRTYYFSGETAVQKKMETAGLQPLKEGMVMGVTGALLLKNPKLVSAIFVESHVGIGDSKAAAKIVEILDKYLNLDVDFKPLLKAAVEFEGKLKNILEKGQQQADVQDKTKVNYFG